MFNMQMVKLRTRFVAGIFVSLLLSAQVHAYATGLVLTSEQKQSLGLQVAEAKLVTQFPSSSYSAQAIFHPKTIRTLSSPLSGRVSKLNVVHGSIAKGQVIAEIESTELLDLQSQLLASLADLRVAENELARVKQLRQSGAASAKKLQQAQAEVNKLRNHKKQQVKALELMGVSKSQVRQLVSKESLQSAVLQMISPIDGQIFDVKVRLGERIAENQSLFSLGETKPMILVVRVPVIVANRLEEGQMADVQSIGLAEIEHIDPAVDAMTQTVDVHVQVENKDNRIRPGQRFQVHFFISPDKPEQHLYQVSSNAISQFEGQTVVFVKENNEIQPRLITVMNITNNLLYFALQQPAIIPLEVFVKGSTAIKSALDAATEDSDA